MLDTLLFRDIYVLTESKCLKDYLTNFVIYIKTLIVPLVTFVNCHANVILDERPFAQLLQGKLELLQIALLTPL